jgi:integrase
LVCPKGKGVKKQLMASRGENRLTDTGLRRVKLTEGKTLVLDGGGLRALVTEAGGRRVARFVFRFRFNGSRIDMRLGTWPDKSLAEIRELRDKARARARAGSDPRKAAREERAEEARQAEEEERKRAEAEARLTVRGLFEKWDRLHLHRAYKDGGAEPRRYFEKDILPLLGDLPAEDISRAHVARVVDAALERKAPRVAALLLTYFRQLSRWGQARGYLETDPTAALRKASIPTNKPRERTLSDDELRELSRRLPEAGLPRWASPAIWLLLSTAVRVGELLRARWADIDLARGEWNIPARNAKNGRAHLVHLSDFAVEGFKKLLEIREGEWVVAGRIPGKAADAKALARLVKDRQRLDCLPGRTEPLNKRTTKHAQALALPGGAWTPHDLRRTAATLMQELGVLPSVIEKCLNHTEPALVRRTYQRAEYIPERRDAFSRLGAHLERLVRDDAKTVLVAQEVVLTNPIE